MQKRWNIQELWDSIKQQNLNVTEIPEKRNRIGQGNIFNIMKNFLRLRIGNKPQIQKHRVKNRHT